MIITYLKGPLTCQQNMTHVYLLVLFSNKDQIVMVNGVSMENVHSNYTIQTLKSCGKTANVVSMEHQNKTAK